MPGPPSSVSDPPRPGLSLTAKAAIVCLAALMRVRFVHTPLTTDEGGYVAIGRAWRHGKSLYTDLWVDRPQGLITVYRLWDTIGFSHTWFIRVLAIVVGAVAALALAHLVTVLRSPSAGVVAGLLAAAFSASPALEGFTPSGELLGSTGTVFALLIGCSVLLGRLSPRWMYAAGVAGDIAMSMKQSGIDGLAALGLWLALAFVFRWLPRREAVVRAAQLVAGAATVIAVLVVHGALTGWSAYWYAVNGYRTEQRSLFVGAMWPRFIETAHVARGILLPALMVALAIVIARRGRFTVPHILWVLPLWLLTATGSFLAGGQFFRHYWVIVTFPIAAVSGVVLGSVRAVRWRALVVAAVLVPVAWSWWGIASLSRDEIPLVTGSNTRAVKSEAVADWYRRHAQPGDTLYAMCARADLYANAHADPPYPYLWFDNVHKVPGALHELRGLIASDQRPTYIALFQPPRACGFAGPLAAQLLLHYVRVAFVDGVPILKAVEPEDRPPVQYPWQ